MRTGTGAATGTAVVAGWLLQDLAVVATAGRPQELLELAPWSAPWLLFGAAYGLLSAALARRGRWLPWLPVLAALTWALTPALSPWRFSVRASWLARDVLVLVVAHAVALRLVPGRLGPVRSGLWLGVLGAAAVVHLSGPDAEPSLPLTAVAVLALAAGLVLRGRARPALEVALLALAALVLLPEVAASLRTERPDLPPTSATARPGAPHLLLVVLDTVRADRLGCYGYERATTPLLDRRVAEQFTLYEQARSTSSWTLPSHASLFTGLMPAEHGASHPGLHAYPVHEGTPSLAGELRAAGYRTGGVFANNVYLRTRFGLDRGFEHFDDREAGMLFGYLPLGQLLGASPRIGHLGYREAGTITDLALEWLDAGDGERPDFLALNYMDVHGPNVPPPPYDRAFEERRPHDVLRPSEAFTGLQYDRELLHLDAELDRLLEGLRARGRLDSTAVVITSDHGEGLGDHGFDLHGWTLYEELLHVPLLVKPAVEPGAPPPEPGRSSEPLTGADVFRLMFELAGLEPPPAATPAGAPVAEWYVGPDGVGQVFRERYPERELDRDLLTWLEQGRKLIVSSRGGVEAYDLDQDPGELQPLPVSPDERARLLERAKAWWASRRDPAPASAEVDPRALGRLKHLGYAGDLGDVDPEDTP